MNGEFYSVTGMKLMKRGDVGTVFYMALGVFLAFGINQVLALSLATDMPVVAVESNSMVPTFYKGDILVIQGTSDPSKYSGLLKVGDVIVFSYPGGGTPIVHRIIEINPDGTYQTMGDANQGKQLPFEKRIEPGQIHGKMIFKMPFLGWVKIGATEYVLPNVLQVILIAVVISFIYVVINKYRV